MKTWLADYSARFEEALHRLLWRQWTLLGVAGSELPKEARAPLDPEALLLLTLESARTEPRLFDEVLDWLRLHGQWIDVQRLRNLLREDAEAPDRLVSAAAAFAGVNVTSSKWRRLGASSRKPPPAEPLFLLAKNLWHPDAFIPDELFKRFGYVRSAVELRGMTGEIPIRLAAALRFRLRAMFGIGIRAEALCYLVSGGTGNVNEIARLAGYSNLGTRQAVQELALAQVVGARSAGREKIYEADYYRWRELLPIEDRVSPGRLVPTSEGKLAFQDGRFREHKDPKGGRSRWSKAPELTWVNWRTYFRGMVTILRFLRRPDLGRMTPYVADSGINMAFMTAEGDFLSAVDAPFRPPMPVGPPQEYGEIVLESLSMAAGEPLRRAPR